MFSLCAPGQVSKEEYEKQLSEYSAEDAVDAAATFNSDENKALFSAMGVMDHTRLPRRSWSGVRGGSSFFFVGWEVGHGRGV